MQRLFFTDLPNVGDLYLTYTFLDFEGEPILFLCTDNAKKNYFCLCSEIRNEERWIIAPCENEELKLLVEDKLSIFDFFQSKKEITLVIMGQDRNEKSYLKKFLELEEADIPDRDLFLECDIEAFADYIKSNLGISKSKVVNTQEVTVMSNYSDPYCEDVYISSNRLEDDHAMQPTTNNIKLVLLAA